MASEKPPSGLFWLLALVFGFSLWQKRAHSAQEGRSQPGTMETMDENLIYSPARLTAAQRAQADLIIEQANRADLNPAFMLALAVTESSLRPDVIGDDGQSIGLFQLALPTARDWVSGVLPEQLQDGITNARIAMLEMKRLLLRYPGHTYGDYAEAWTLGGRGRFVLDRRNTAKLVAMQRAIDDLKLNLNLNEGP